MNIRPGIIFSTILACAALLSGCSYPETGTRAGDTSQGKSSAVYLETNATTVGYKAFYQVQCHDGVKYLFNERGSPVMMRTAEDKPATCSQP